MGWVLNVACAPDDQRVPGPMIGGGPAPRDVVQLVERWCPKKADRSEKKFQNNLQDHLDDQLNRGGGGRNLVISKEHSQVNADVAVGDDIGIKLK